MRGLKVLGIATALAALSAILVPGTARADEFNRQTFLTFSGPVSLPGIVLPAGTYTFQIANPESGSRVIQVTDKDRKKIQGFFMAIPSTLTEIPNQPVVKFAERPEGSPEAIKAWFYPGERTGYEFVYPRSQAVKIAKANHEKVLSIPDQTAKNTDNTKPTEVFKSARVERVDENSQLSEVSRSTPPAASNDAQPVVGDVQRANASAPDSAAQLPQTASPFALFALLSVMSLAAGLGLRSLRIAR